MSCVRGKGRATGGQSPALWFVQLDTVYLIASPGKMLIIGSLRSFQNAADGITFALHETQEVIQTNRTVPGTCSLRARHAGGVKPPHQEACMRLRWSVTAGRRLPPRPGRI